MGLYSVLWGKYKEYQEIEAELMALPEVSSAKKMITTFPAMDHEDNVDDIEMQKAGEAKTDSAGVAVEVPVQQSSSISMGSPRP